MERKKGFMAAFMTGLLWGVSSPMAQYLFDCKGVVSEWLVPFRLMTAGIFLMLYAAVVKKQKIFSVWKSRNDALRQLAFAIMGMMGMQYSFFSAVQEMNAGTATIFQYLNPAMLIFYYALVYRIMPRGKEIAAVLCSLSGIFLVATHGNIHALSVSPRGLALGLILALTTCFYGILPGPLLKKYPSEMICAWAMTAGGVVLMAVFRPWEIHVDMDPVVLIIFFAIVVLGTILPFCLYLSAVENIGTVYAGLLSSVEPVAATILAAVCLGTAFEAVDLLGFALVLSTMFILNIQTGRGKTADRCA
ncbi:MAG: DMT family transporter [Lachnospiraceae bacterium]|nr:DMT family transporter [Lachnospiraceae bacterium]